jgi:hypothetical protein
MCTVRQTIDIAVSVMEDYGEAGADTRIARLARWVILNLGVDVYKRELGCIAHIGTDAKGVAALQVGGSVALLTQAPTQSLSYESARQLATALFIAVERAEITR